MSALRGLRWLTGVALTAALATGSCRTATACAPPAAPVVLGSWDYAATQTSPTSASLSGVLQITSQCGHDFGGTLTGTQTDASGNHPFTGVVNGSAVDTVVDFDAFLDPTPRRHVGKVRSDSMRGTWVEPTDAGTLSGAFTSAWTSTP